MEFAGQGQGSDRGVRGAGGDRRTGLVEVNGEQGLGVAGGHGTSRCADIAPAAPVGEGRRHAAFAATTALAAASMISQAGTST